MPTWTKWSQQIGVSFAADIKSCFIDRSMTSIVNYKWLSDNVLHADSKRRLPLPVREEYLKITILLSLMDVNEVLQQPKHSCPMVQTYANDKKGNQSFRSSFRYVLSFSQKKKNIAWYELSIPSSEYWPFARKQSFKLRGRLPRDVYPTKHKLILAG